MKIQSLLVASLLLASPSYAAVLITINISDISAVTFSATGGLSAVNSSLSASANGFTIENFFTGSPSIVYGDNVTGNLSPIVGTTQAYSRTGTYDFSDGTEAFKPGNDLNITAGGSTGANSQVFSTGSPVFNGVATMNLSAFAANLPTDGATGAIYPGFSSGPSAGEWVAVVPEPNSILLLGIAGMLGFFRRRA